MSTIDDLIPDVEYESDASTNSTASVARKKILKSNEKFDAVNSVPAWILFIIGIIAFLGALFAPFIPWVGNKINGFSKPIQLTIQTVIYMVIYGISWILKFINVF